MPAHLEFVHLEKLKLGGLASPTLHLQEADHSAIGADHAVWHGTVTWGCEFPIKATFRLGVVADLLLDLFL
jgi:hypothetical protein